MVEVGAGHVIAGKYRLDRRLGEGGMGSVWSAEHLDLRSKVAIKLIVSSYANNPVIASRFVREARAAAALRSPHVVQILDFGVDQGLAYIAMEQLEGESLGERLRREHRLSPALTATIVTHMARAIAKAHEASLVHRDLKPDNVFLIQNDDEVVAKLLDFGVAKTHTDGEAPMSTRTETGVVVGSPYYMSPEQARGRRDIDYRSDLWAIGVIAFECLVGRRPFTGESMGEVILAICTEPIPVPSAFASVPPGFDEWFARAAERDLTRRFQSPKDLAASLRRVLAPGSDGAVDGGILDAPAPAAEPSLVAHPSAAVRSSATTRRSPHPEPLPAALPTTQLDGLASQEPVLAGSEEAPRSAPREPVLVETGRTFGATTTGPTSHARTTPSHSAPPAPEPSTRFGTLAIVFVVLAAAAVAWLAGRRAPADSSLSSASAPSASPASQPVIERTAPSVAAVENSHPVPIAASVDSAANVPPGSATAPPKPVKSSERARAKPSTSSSSPKANPLDIRF